MKLFNYTLLSPEHYESTYNYRVYKLPYYKRVLIELFLITIFSIFIFWATK